MTLSTGDAVISKKHRSLRNEEDMEWAAIPAGTNGKVLSVEETYGKKWASIRWLLGNSPLDDQIIEDDWESYLSPGV